MPLKSRRQFPARGWFFFESRTGWTAPSMLDFETTVSEIIQHRLANPRFKNEWSTDRDAVRDELDRQTCLQLASMGLAEQYCTSGNESSFQPGPAPQQPWLGRKLRESAAVVKKMVSGVAVLIEWLGEGGQPVARPLAASRAGVCASCPKNRPGKLSEFFTEETSELIRKQLAIKSDMTLETEHDAQLGVCDACLCPLQLKVWTPLVHITKHLKPNVRAQLDPRCWITKE